MNIRRVIYATGILLAAASSSCDKNNNNKLNDADQDFMTKASISNSAEVGAGTLASVKATNAAVKTFAQHMVMEHTMAQNDLKSLGTSVGYAVKDTIDPEHVAITAQLNALSGRAFDSAYIYSQIPDHDKAIATFQTEQATGRHSDVKNYANTYLPHIQMHRVSADSISTAYFKK